MGLFDMFKKKVVVEKDGTPKRVVVMEDKDTLYAPAPGAVVFLDAATETGTIPEGAAGITIDPTIGAIWAPQTGNISFDVERNELTIVNFMDVDVLVRLVPGPEDGNAQIKPLVEDGAHVHVGDPVASFDLAEGTAHLVVLVTNAEDFAGVQPATEEPVEVGDTLLLVLRK